MKGRVVCVSLLVVLVVALLLCVSDFRVAEAQSIITINSDGTFSPSGAALTKSTEEGRDIYTLTSDIFDSTIVVAKYHVTIDGAGHSLSGTSGIEAGMVLSGMQGVIVKNLEIQGFQTGVTMQNCGSCQLISNTIINNEKGGIEISGTSTWNNLAKNTIKGNRGFGISLNGAVEHTTIIKNLIEKNQFGIDINDLSKENLVGGNAFVDNARHYGDYNGQQNKWNSDYDVAKGNYWSDYAARGYPLEDLKKGPNQDQAGSDGVWDHPYFVYVEAGVTDSFPLVECKFPSTITCSAKPSSIFYITPESWVVSITGRIIPEPEEAVVLLKITHLNATGTSRVSIHEVRTHAPGSFGYVFYLPQDEDKSSLVPDQLYEVEASWSGSATLEGAKSLTQRFGTHSVYPTTNPEDDAPFIPGFPMESIVIGVLLAFFALYLGRRRRLSFPLGAPK